MIRCSAGHITFLTRGSSARARAKEKLKDKKKHPNSGSTLFLAFIVAIDLAFDFLHQ